MADQKQEPGEHPWALIWRRLARPWKQWSFWAVLVVGIVVLGYLAVWIEEAHVISRAAQNETVDLQPLRLAYATAILAVGIPCLMQLMLTVNKMAVVTVIFLGLFVFGLAYFVGIDSPTLVSVHSLGLPGLVLATFAWWLANGEDDLYQDHVRPDAPSGGDPLRDLPGGKSGVQV